MNQLNINDMAPDFEAITDQGEKTSLKDYLGQRIVLYFYPKDDTSGCTTQACGFRDNYPEIQEKNAVVLGVSPDGVESHQKFKTKEWEFNNLCISDARHSGKCHAPACNLFSAHS